MLGKPYSFRRRTLTFLLMLIVGLPLSILGYAVDKELGK